MPTISNSSKPIRLGDATVRSVGVTGDVDAGLPRTRGRTDEIEAHVRRPAVEGDDSPGFRLSAELTATIRGVDRDATRAGGRRLDRDEQPCLVIDGPPLAAGESGQIAVVEEGRFVSFVLPSVPHGTEAARFEIPVDPVSLDELSRGATQQLASIGIRILNVIGAKRVAAAGTRFAARSIEGHLRPHRLRDFGAGVHTANDAVSPKSLRGESALLLIHGTNSSCRRSFGFDGRYIETLRERYGGLVLAFDHPSICCSPAENAAELATLLEDADLHRVDILAHSRGGLVARSLLQLAPKGIEVRSVVFAGTPNRGTPLADPERPDRLLSMVSNVVSVIPDNPVTDPIGIALEVLREWVLDPIAGLPGLAAMRPGSDELTRLAEHDGGGARFRAVAANFEPRSNDAVPTRLRNVLMDQVFDGEDNDLVVPTRSAYVRSGAFHVRPDDRLVLDSSFGVSHSGFWRSSHVLGQLDQWLDPAITLDRAQVAHDAYLDVAADFEEAQRAGDDPQRVRDGALLLRIDHLDAATGMARSAVSRAGRVGAPRGVVVVVPGIMGSHLDVDGREIWLNPWHLLRGRFPLLALGANRVVRPTRLLKQYERLVARLAQSWEVVPFPYDWRLPIETSASRLADELDRRGVDLDGDRPVHVVAHSMGGLVARRLLDGWRDRWNGRLVQLGTPNLGSFAMPLAVLGEERLVRALVAADVMSSEREILDTIASFPGVFELFPSPKCRLPDGDIAHAALYQARTWAERDRTTIEPLLAAAASFHDVLDQSEPLPRWVYVAGDGHRTPYRTRIEADGSVSFGITTRGDGRVPHDFGFEGLVPADDVYYADSDHGDLITDRSVLAAIDDLLEHGRSDVLRRASRSARSSDAARQVEWKPAAEIETIAGFAPRTLRGTRTLSVTERAEQLEDAAAIYVGRSGPRRAPLAPLRVRVVHGSLEQANHPVAAGRYQGIPVAGALEYIDQRFKRALTALQDLGMFPQEAGSSRYVPAPPDVYPIGAILLGLGAFGTLRPELLTQAVRSGTIEYALHARLADPAADEPPTLGVASVLIGTPGRYGLTVVDSIAATIRGVARAAVELEGLAVIDELELIELYEGAADHAHAALRRLEGSSELLDMGVEIHVEPEIDTRPGGRPGSRGYDESGAPWPRVMLELDEEGREDQSGARLRTLRYVSIGRGAQAGNFEVQVNISEILRHVRTAMASVEHDDQVRNTLFELMFPNDAKLDIESFDNLHLLVGEETAWIPWEMFAGRGLSGQMNRPLALRAGFLRQLKSVDPQAPRRTFASTSTKALVIGDPPSGRSAYGRLQGARDEAVLVADLLGGGERFDVTSLVYDELEEGSDEIAAAVRDALYAQHYRIIHIAAHGDVFPDAPGGTDAAGVIIGPNDMLTSRHFRQKLVVPDLVFLNCCHVGAIQMSAALERRRASFAEVASSIALELMAGGVKAVVAAGWAVDDHAAAEFAGTFYRQMLGGASFGKAVLEARRAAEDGGRSNTWGAYQCYGDPDFQLAPAARPLQATTGVSSVGQLTRSLIALGERAGDSSAPDHCTQVLEELREYERLHVVRYQGAAAWRALAGAYREVGAFDDAVHAYRAALDHSENGAVTLQDIQRLANLEVRLATHLHRPGEGAPSRPGSVVAVGRGLIGDSPRTLFRTAEARLKTLQRLRETAECHALLGSLHKKWATIETGQRQADHMRRSRDAYSEACDLPAQGPGSENADLNVYHACLAVIMEYVVGRHSRVEDLPDRYAHYVGRLEKQRPKYRRDSGGYFERAQGADIDAALTIVRGELTDAAKRAALVSGFNGAFRVRSTARDRMSVIDNYFDLSVLLWTADLRAAAASIAQELEAFASQSDRAPGGTGGGR